MNEADAILAMVQEERIQAQDLLERLEHQGVHSSLTSSVRGRHRALVDVENNIRQMMAQWRES